MNKTTPSTTVTPSALSRRDFLRASTAAVGTLFTAGVPFSFLDSRFSTSINAIAAQALHGRIAVLMPRQGVGETAYTAFTHVFDKQYPGVELLTRQVRPYWSDVTQAARQLIEADGVKVIVTLMNPTLSPAARDLFASTDTLLIVASAGENIVRQEDVLPNIFHTSLHLWETNYALGQWAVKHYGKRGVMTSSLYDSGFDAFHAFEMGVEAAGGTIVSRYVQAANERSTSAALRNTLHRHTSDFVFHMNSTDSQFEIDLTTGAQAFALPVVHSPLTAASLIAVYNGLGTDATALTATALSTLQAHPGDLTAVFQTLNGLELSTRQRLAVTDIILPTVDCQCAIERISAGSIKTGFSTPYMIL